MCKLDNFVGFWQLSPSISTLQDKVKDYAEKNDCNAVTVLGNSYQIQPEWGFNVRFGGAS